MFGRASQIGVAGVSGPQRHEAKAGEIPSASPGAGSLSQDPNSGAATPETVTPTNIDGASTPAMTGEPSRGNPPGPGLPESLAWAVMILLAQFFAAISFVVVIFVGVAIASGGHIPRGTFDLETLGPDGFVAVTGVPAVMAYLVLIPLACWRMSPHALRRLNFAPPSWTQLIIACSCVIPMGLASDALFALVSPWWQHILETYPLPPQLQQMGLAEHMERLSGASLPLLLLFLAAVPAVGEEWILRGLIGRGLVARWGVVPGVLLTSLLFAAIHIDPPHVVAVLPMGLLLHVIYLTTRSFWMPILFHFLNNATVSIFTALGQAEPGEPVTGNVWWLYVAPLWIGLATWLLWKLRTCYVDVHGHTLSRSYFSAEAFPEHEAHRVAPNHALAATVFGILLAVQIAAVAWQIRSLRNEGVPARTAGVAAAFEQAPPSSPESGVPAEVWRPRLPFVSQLHV